MAPKATDRNPSGNVTDAGADTALTAAEPSKDKQDDLDNDSYGDDSGSSESGENEGDSDDSSSGDIDVDAETAHQLLTLEQDLQTTPSYEKYLEYIELLRTAPGLRKRLRDAYEDMAARFPLSEELWLAWINDELTAVSGPDDVAWLLGLLRRAATRDYLAPAVWELYLEMVHDLDPAVRDLAPEGVERYRALCEEALAAAGLHLAAAHRLWEKYRRYELSVESKPAQGSSGSGASSAAASKQQDRVRALYHRQLQVPLQDVAQTLEEYKAWEARHGKSVPTHMAKAAAKAREAAELRAGFEAGVAAEAPADVAKLGAFLSYIRMEQNAGDSARVQVLYERAVAAFPLTHSLWLQYGQYMETHTKLPGPINHVYKRAVRNCPWVSAVWERAIRALDRTGAAPEAVDEMYDSALKAGLQAADDYLAVILARLDYLRRRAAEAAGGSSGGPAKKATVAVFGKLREAFSSSSEFMMSHFPDHIDRSLSLSAYWAHCEVHVLCDMAAAREVWEGALKGGLGRYAEAWEAYIGMERSARHIKEARALYKRCYSRRLEDDGQLRLCHAWLRFEREEGSADDYLQAILKVEPILEESAAAAAAAADQATAAAAKAAVQKAKNLTKEDMKALRQAKDPNFQKLKKDVAGKDKGTKAAKRGRQEDGQETRAGSADEPASTKRVRTYEPEVNVPGTEPAVAAARGGTTAPPDGDGDADMADQDNAAPAPHRDCAEAVGAVDEQQAGPGPGTTKAQAGGRPHFTDQLTVFIKGLRPALKDGELDTFLKAEVPEGLKDVRLIRDSTTGQSRGFAYVECSSREALEKAVALNGTPFQGISLFIAESKPPGRGPGGWAPGARGRFGGRFGGQLGSRGFTGRGRSRGRGSDGGSGGAGGDTDAEMVEAGESAVGTSGGRGSQGGRGWGRGGRHPGLGHPTGRGAMRTHLQISEGSAPPTALVPRSVQLSKGGGGEAAVASGGAAAGYVASAGQQLSNDDFRKMLLGGKK